MQEHRIVTEHIFTKGIEYVPINLDYISTFDEKLSLFMYHAYSLMSKLTISKKLTQWIL